MRQCTGCGETKATYGITPAQFAEMCAAQDNCCAICDVRGPLCVDHGHVTGRIRLLLCKPCNLAVAWAEKYGRDAVDALAGYLDWIGIEGRA